MAAATEKLPHYVRAFARALIAVEPVSIKVPGFEPEVVGNPSGRVGRVKFEVEGDFLELHLKHRYRFALGDGPLDVWIDFYKNNRDHWRLFAFCNEGSLLSLNLTLAHKAERVVKLGQHLVFSDRTRPAEARQRAMEALCARLRALQFEVTETRDIVFPSFDAKSGEFVGTSAEAFIRDFIVAAVLKGHYMENKRYRLPERASSKLAIGKTYSRGELKALFDVRDASINNGTFHVKPYRSVWLFMTENKTPDRTQYQDALVGDELRMEGQTEGKTDRLIREHVSLGLELLLFYRKSKKEHPHGAFVYEGPFRYVSHEGARPTRFILQRERLATAVHAAKTGAAFDPDNLEDARKRAQAEVVRRPEQDMFRRALLSAYRKCAVTWCEVAVALDAAHIMPYRGEHTDHVKNGLLLRADIHRLFDERLLAVDTETMTVRIAKSLTGTIYQELEGRKLHLPDEDELRPDVRVLNRHRQEAGL